MTISNVWVNNDNVKLHYVDGNIEVDQALTPLFHIPGAFGSAESFLKDLESLSPRRCISISLRGRGKSDVPENGYTFEKLVSDAETVIDNAQLDSFFIYAFSMGVPPALGYAIKHPERVKGIIIDDYGACYLKQPIQWTEKFKRFPDLVNFTAVLGTQRDSENIPLWDALSKLQCPVLILTGANKDADIPPVLNNEMIDKYKTSLRHVSFRTFEQSGHRLWEPDYDAYINAIRSFLDKVEKHA